jgi:hypothetical protein
MRALVENEVDLRNDPAVRVSAGDDAGVAGGVIELAVVGQVGMTGDQDVDRRIERIVDRNDRA